MTQRQERRSAFRMDVVSKAMCRLNAGTRSISGAIRDISIAGLYMRTAERPAVGDEFDVEIILEGRYSRMIIDTMRGAIIRHDANGIAVQFSERFEWFAMVPLYFHTATEQPVRL